MVPLLSWGSFPFPMAGGGSGSGLGLGVFAQTPPIVPNQAPGIPEWLVVPLQWLAVWGDPNVTDTTYGEFAGQFMTWVKVMAWVCVVCWVGNWVIESFRRPNRKARLTDYGLLAGVLLGLGAIYLETSFRTGAIANQPRLGSLNVSTILGLTGIGLIAIWIERALIGGILARRSSGAAALLVLLHAAFALGFAVAYGVSQLGYISPRLVGPTGFRYGVTYMGIVVFAATAAGAIGEILSIRWTRLFAIARVTIYEATRPMKAPWVVLVVFLVILAFTHWFLQPPEDQRAAELSRLYVSALMILQTLLICMMVAIIMPLSLPKDIENQTIYTVVTKPVRRLELLWGRVLGVMILVTALLAVSGVISVIYLNRLVNNAITRTLDDADALRERDPFRSDKLYEQAAELETRRSARVPVMGSLTFTDSRGRPVGIKGIDVGQEQVKRSHIEGATEASAIWRFGERIIDPLDDLRRQAFLESRPDLTMEDLPPPKLISKPVPVRDLLGSNTIEAFEDQYYTLQQDRRMALARANQPGIDANAATRERDRANQMEGEINRLIGEIKKLKAQDQEYRTKAAEARDAGDEAAMRRYLDESDRLHSPPVTLEMTFIIYRTVKGIVSEPIFANIEVVNPNRFEEDARLIAAEDPKTGAPLREEGAGGRSRNSIPILEYYTNRLEFPASVLAGSRGDLLVQVQCVNSNQYLGMSEDDLYIVKSSGDFGTNFLFGLWGIWLQALVLASVGVFVATMLSWRVAFLATLFFFVAGLVGFSFVTGFFQASLQGGGPFESMIRLVNHQNLMADLTPTFGVLVAKTLDSIASPILATMAFVVPNLSAFDFRNTVADGFAVGWDQTIGSSLLALAYALPFTLLGLYIFKKREVAA